MRNRMKHILLSIIIGGLMMSMLTGCGVGKHETTIKGSFEKYNMKAGTCISPNMITNSDYEQIIRDNFNSITLENAMKPDYILNKSKSIKAGDLVVEFNRDMKKILDWAKTNNMAVRGHTLIWYSQTPDWIFYENFDTKNDLVSREVMLARMESYIKQVFSLLSEQGYIDMFYAYTSS